MKIIEQIKTITEQPNSYRFLIVNPTADKQIREELFTDTSVQVSITNLYGLNYYVSNWFKKLEPLTQEDNDNPLPLPEAKPQYILSEMNLHQIVSQYNVLMSDTQEPKTIEELVNTNVLFVNDLI